MQMDVYNMGMEQQFNWATNNQAMYTVINPNATNVWGTPTGYRVVPGRSNVYLSTLHSPWLLNNCHFAKSRLALSR